MNKELKRVTDERDYFRSVLFLCRTEAHQSRGKKKAGLKLALKTIQEIADEALGKAEPKAEEDGDEKTN